MKITCSHHRRRRRRMSIIWISQDKYKSENRDE